MTMNININGRTEELVNAALSSGEFATIEEFLNAMVNRWQSEQKLPSMVGHTDIDQLPATKIVKPFDLSERPSPELWPQDESTDEFLQFIRAARAESVSEGTSL